MRLDQRQRPKRPHIDGVFHRVTIGAAALPMLAKKAVLDQRFDCRNDCLLGCTKLVSHALFCGPNTRAIIARLVRHKHHDGFASDAAYLALVHL